MVVPIPQSMYRGPLGTNTKKFLLSCSVGTWNWTCSGAGIQICHSFTRHADGVETEVPHSLTVYNNNGHESLTVSVIWCCKKWGDTAEPCLWLGVIMAGTLRPQFCTDCGSKWCHQHKMADLVSRYFDFIFVGWDEVETCPSHLCQWCYGLCICWNWGLWCFFLYILHLIPVLSIFMEDIQMHMNPKSKRKE